MPDRQQMIEPLAHRLLQIVIRPAEGGIAAGDKVVLLALQGAAGARIVAAASLTAAAFTALIWRSRLASSGLAQIAFSTARRARWRN